MLKIKIEGKEYPCRITMGAMIRYKNETGKDVSQLGTGDVTGMITFLWCCVKSACEVDGEEMQYSVMEMADRLGPEMLNMFYKEKAESEGEEKKKKANA